jgi:hypothetical protein
METQFITRIWANDGWCYIPEFKKREKFIEYSPSVIKIEEEEYQGIIPSVEYEERVEYHLIKKKPMVWAENTEWGHEKFSETISTPHSK